jgi:hypothetical protein
MAVAVHPSEQENWNRLVEQAPDIAADCEHALAEEPFPYWPSSGHFPLPGFLGPEDVWAWERPGVRVVYKRGGDGLPKLVRVQLFTVSTS